MWNDRNSSSPPCSLWPSLLLSIWCWVVLVLHQTNLMAPDDDILSQWKMERQLLIYNRQLERLDTHFRKLCRSIVGPPPGTDWTLEWHEILHQWNVRVNIFIDKANIKTWSRICCLNYWRLAQHVAMLSQELGSTNFAMVPGWNIPNRPPTFPLGVETSIVLQIQRLGAMDGCCHESEPLGSTLRILHWILQYIQCLDSPLCSIFVEQLDTFCACALKGLANIGVQVWLDLTLINDSIKPSHAWDHMIHSLDCTIFLKRR